MGGHDPNTGVDRIARRRWPEIDVIIPTLWRADRLAGLVDNVHETTAAAHLVTFVVERDDPDTAAAVFEIQSRPDPSVRLVVNEGARNTAGAYNTATRICETPFWFAGADDLVFHDEWDVPALAAMRPPIAVVGTNDLAGHPEVLAGRAATHYLVLTSYIREQGGTVDLGAGVAFFEGYPHWGPDSEIVGVARARGVFAPCLEAVVEHRHWLVGKAEMDRTYLDKHGGHAEAAQVYEQRRHLWEDL